MARLDGATLNVLLLGLGALLGQVGNLWKQLRPTPAQLLRKLDDALARIETLEARDTDWARFYADTRASLALRGIELPFPPFLTGGPTPTPRTTTEDVHQDQDGGPR